MQIKHRFTGKVLFECEAGSIKLTIEAAVEKKAYLGGADLGGADLGGADLRGADLGGADLGGAYLRGAYLIDAGQDSRGYRFVAQRPDPDKAYVIVAGCRFFTLAEARAHWKTEHANNPALAAECRGKVELIAAVAEARGWKE